MSLKVLFIFFALLPFISKAAEIPQHYQSIRSLGMGGVYIFSDSDSSVIFKNPAGLGRISGLNIAVFDIDFGVNGLQVYNDLKDVGNISGIGSLGSFYGKNIWVGADGYSSIALPYFGFAVFDNGYTAFRLDNPSYPNLNIQYFNDYGYQIGGALALGPNLYLGLGAKRTVRKGGLQNLGGASLTTITNSTLQSAFEDEGVGYGLDTGLLYVVPAPMSPTISLSWLDAGSTAFLKTNGTNSPQGIKDNLTLSTTFSSDVPLLGLSGGIEYRHITDSNEPLGKKIHIGAELSVAMLDLRAGFYQGYTTYGVGLDLFFMQLDAAMYSVEKGAYAGQTKDDRIEISLSMDFSFDPSFNLTGAGGKKRKLKQRR